MQRSLIAAGVALLCLFNAHVAAEDGASRFRFGALYVSPTDDLAIAQDVDFLINGPNGQFPATLSVPTVLEADAALGVELGFEYRATDLIGFDISIGRATHDVDLTIRSTMTTIPDPLGQPGDTVNVTVAGSEEKFGEATQIPIVLGPTFHVLKDSVVDLYLGPQIGFTIWDDLELERGGGDVSLDDEFTWGAQVGLDVPLGDTWAFNVMARYRVLEAAVEDDDEGDDVIDINPVEARIGFSVRF